MVYLEPLLTIKGCPYITTKGKSMDSLEYFSDQGYIAHTYHTRSDIQPNIVVSTSL